MLHFLFFLVIGNIFFFLRKIIMGAVCSAGMVEKNGELGGNGNGKEV